VFLPVDNEGVCYSFTVHWARRILVGNKPNWGISKKLPPIAPYILNLKRGQKGHAVRIHPGTAGTALPVVWSVRFTEAAREELIVAQDWYEAGAPGSGQRFRAEFENYGLATHGWSQRRIARPFASQKAQNV
jgi:hypothetical protein